MSSSVRLSVCLSVTFVHSTQAIEIFSNVSTPFNRLRWLSDDIQEKFYGDRPRGTPPSGDLNTRGVAKYTILDLSEAIYIGNDVAR